MFFHFLHLSPQILGYFIINFREHLLPVWPQSLLCPSKCLQNLQLIVKLRQGSGKDRQGMTRNGSQGERPQILNPCLELTLKLVAQG